MTPEQLRYSILGQAFRGLLTKPNEEVCFQNIRMLDIDDVPFDIPEQWEWKTLGNICEMYTGNSIAESEKKLKYCGIREGYDYIATKDVSYEQKIEYDNGVKIPYDTDFKIAKQNSILMCIEGGSAGRKLAVVEHDVCFGNKLCMFMPFEVYNLYLFYYLQSAEFKFQFSNNMTGIIGGVSIKKLKNLYIPLPSINEQREIVSQIEKFLPYVNRYTFAYDKLKSFTKQFPENMKKSILQYAMQGKLVEQKAEEGTGEELYWQIQAEKQKLIKEGKIKKEKKLPKILENEIPFDIPNTWMWIKVGNIFTVIRGSSPRPKGSSMYWSEQKTDYNWITIKDISAFCKNGVLSETTEYLTEAGADLSTYVGEEELIIAVSGSTTGKHCILGMDGYIYDGLAAILNPTKIISSSFLLLFFDWVYDRLNAQKVGSAFPNISTDILKNTLMPLPPLGEQKRIVMAMEHIVPYFKRLKKD